MVAAGVLATLAFPAADLGWLAWVALVPLLWALDRAGRPRRALWYGYLFGLVHWGAITPWIGATVAWWAGGPVGWVAWVGLNLIESAWFGLFGLLAWGVARRTRGLARALGIAAAWTLVEWLRTQGGLAMPWGLLGYTQHAYPSVIQVASLGGVYLVSFTVALANAALAGALPAAGSRVHAPAPDEQRAQRTIAARPRWFAVSSALTLAASGVWVGAACAYGLWALQQPPVGRPIRIAVVQLGLTREQQVNPNPATELEKLRAQAARIPPAELAPGRISLSVWPESAAPAAGVVDPDVREAFATIARQTGNWQVVGTGYRDARGRPSNAAALFAPDGRLAGRYDKHQLVPYGEWMPARAWMPFAQVFHYVEQDLVPGTSDEPLDAGGAPISPLICYESVFPQLARARAAHGAQLLVNVTNDAWAGQSAEMWQHAAMTAMRAVETGRWTAVAATTGISGVISPKGRFMAAPPYRPYVMKTELELIDTITPYVRLGDWIVLLSAVLVALILVRRRVPSAPRGAADTPS